MINVKRKAIVELLKEYNLEKPIAPATLEVKQKRRWF